MASQDQPVKYYPVPEMVLSREIEHRTRFGQIITPQDFYISYADYSKLEGRDELTAEINRIYRPMEAKNSLPAPLTPLRVGDHCIFQAGMNFARGVIREVKEKKAKIFDVDVGDVTSRVFDKIFPVPDIDYIRRTPMTFFHCKLYDVAPPPREKTWIKSTIKWFVEEYGGKNLRCFFMEREGDMYSVLFEMTGGRVVADHFICTGLASQPKRPPPPPSCFPTLSINARLNDHVPVIVSYVKSSAIFFVQLQINEDLISKLSREVNFEYGRNGDKYKPVDPIRYRYCAARYGYDGHWYRAIIIGRPTPTKLEVQFADYGNTAKLPAKEVKMLKQDFARDPAQGIECRLVGVPEKEELTKTFSDVAESKRMNIVIVNHDDDHLCVLLYQIVSGKPYSINDYLNGLGPCPPESIVTFPDSDRELSDEEEDEGAFGFRDRY